MFVEDVIEKILVMIVIGFFGVGKMMFVNYILRG